jgi:hypothetical protein
MAIQVQIRRDTATNLASTTPVIGEAGYDTTNKNLLVGDGTRTGGIPHLSYKHDQTQRFRYATTTGTANAILLDLIEPLDAYAEGVAVEFKASASNTTTTTVNVNSLGVKTIKKISPSGLVDLGANDILNGGIYRIVYNGTYFVISGGQSSSAFRLISSVSISGTPQTVDYANIFVANKNYRIVLSNIIPSGNAHVYFLFGSSGVAWLTSSYSHSAVEGTDTNNSTSASQIALTATQIDSGGVSGFSGVINVISPMMSTGYKKINGLLTHRKVSTSQTVTSYFGGDYVGDVASKASFRIDLESTNTFTSGLISVYEQDAT